MMTLLHAMASPISISLTLTLSAPQILPPCSTHGKAIACKHAPLPTRRQWLVVLTATAALKAAEMPARAQDIPLFGLRKSIRKAEKEAEQLVKEGFEAADKGMEAAEKGVEAAEKGVEAAGKEIETVLSFGGLAQAGVVVGAEALGVLIATSIVNGILGPEAQKS